MRIGIVRAKFNERITDRMLRAALAQAKKRGARVPGVIEVPGAFDIPLAAQKLAKRKDIDAVATLGAIIKGGTKHDEVIATALAVHLPAISLKSQKPVSLGVIGPGASESKAVARAVDYARRAIDAAIELSEATK